MVWTRRMKRGGVLWEGCGKGADPGQAQKRKTADDMAGEAEKRPKGAWLGPGRPPRQKLLETEDPHGGPYDKWDNVFEIK